MGDYNEALIKAGVWVDGNGLKPSEFGARIEFSNGEPMVIDGPFAETDGLEKHRQNDELLASLKEKNK